MAIRLRAGRGGPSSGRNSWIGTEAFIQERVEIWRGERLRNNLPLLLISASLLLSAVLFLLLPLWRRDAPEYFWFGLWLLVVSILRVCQASPDIVGLEGSLASRWIVLLLTAGSGLCWLGWMRTLFLSRITQAVWLAAAAIVAHALGLGAFYTAGGGYTPPLLGFSLIMLPTACLAFVYYQLGWQSSRAADRMPFVHIAIMVYLAVAFAGYGAPFFSPTSVMATQGTLARTITGLLFAFVMTILMNQRSARLLVEASA